MLYNVLARATEVSLDNSSLTMSCTGIFVFRSLVDASGIQAYKANATDNNYSYGLAFTTRANGGDLTANMRLDENGTPKIFEINSRHSGTTYIRSLFGYKEIEYIINLLLFNKEIEFDLREGTVVRYFDEFYIEK